MRRLRGLSVGLAISWLVLSVVIGVCGYPLFNHSRIDPLQQVDAIVVLGGDQDGREAYGIDLARKGLSSSVVLSNPYYPPSKSMLKACATVDENFTVTCVRPSPPTTRGEAMFTQELAERNGWDTVLVISWRYHLPRARYVFSQCFGGNTVMRPVPRDYDFSLAEWEYTYFYQLAGFAKAFFQGPC
ncbi:YdcF family protein (plasmid) [Rhodococcus sp. USK10]|uniref:YdcF family protein n=1 Tax=Rhodococcus sp. USK10 TaxID=2789739 RepID=UPI001C5E9042|nr:YdcF family protein [Rhodococcus sp. USK10]QYB00084.1 YdcF family protein [Rhodococcus sp. USK10]